MEPTTVRLPEDLVDDLDSEYADYGYSTRAEYIRAILRNRHEHGATTDATTATTTDYATKARVRDLERRVERLENSDTQAVDEHEPRPAPEPTPEAEQEIDDRVWAAVDAVASSWDQDDRWDARRTAAAHVLQYALEHDEHIGKSHEAVAKIREQHPVAGQDDETWWRQNVRDVLAEYGDYSRGQHGYHVESLET